MDARSRPTRYDEGAKANIQTRPAVAAAVATMLCGGDLRAVCLVRAIVLMAVCDDGCGVGCRCDGWLLVGWVGGVLMWMVRGASGG